MFPALITYSQSVSLQRFIVPLYMLSAETYIYIYIYIERERERERERENTQQLHLLIKTKLDKLPKSTQTHTRIR